MLAPNCRNGSCRFISFCIKILESPDFLTQRVTWLDNVWSLYWDKILFYFLLGFYLQIVISGFLVLLKSLNYMIYLFISNMLHNFFVIITFGRCVSIWQNKIFLYPIRFKELKNSIPSSRVVELKYGFC